MPVGDLVVTDENRPEGFAEFDETRNVFVSGNVLLECGFLGYVLF